MSLFTLNAEKSLFGEVEGFFVPFSLLSFEDNMIYASRDQFCGSLSSH